MKTRNYKMRREDPLTKRCRKIVAEEMRNEDLIEFPVHGVKFIVNDKTSITKKILWIIILLLCFLIFMYQSYGRVTYFLSHPTETDVVIEGRNSFDMPVLVDCAQETEALERISAQASQFQWGMAGFFPLIARLNNPNIDLYYLWNATNISSLITKLYYRMPSGLTIVPRNLFFEYHVKGLCISFYPDEGLTVDSHLVYQEKKIESKSVQRVSMIGWRSLHEPKHGIKFVIHLTGNEYNYYFSILTYNFLNKSSMPCQSEDNYKICAENCFKKRYLEEMVCKFPFFPEGIELPICKASPILQDEYYRAEKINQETSPFIHCNCILPCSSTRFWTYTVIYPIDDNETKLTISSETPLTVQIKERWSYESISLFCDIGGNLGLLTGLSLLGLLDSLMLIRHFIQKKRELKIKRLHPLHKIVRKYIRREKYLFQSSQEHVKKDWCSLHFLATCALWIISIYLIVKKIQYFYEYPTAVSITVKENATIEFPNAAVCGTSVKLSGLYNKYKKKNGIDNICEIHFLDLLDLPKVDAKKLWDYSDCNSLQMQIDYRAIVSPLNVRNESTIAMYQGTCIYFEVGKHNYSKDLTMMKIFSPNEKDRCSYFAQQLYLTSPSEDFNIASSPILIPRNTLNAVTVDISEVDKTESPDFLCTNDPGETLNCKRKCLKDNLSGKLPCRLPFMDVDLNFCKNASYGKIAYYKYVNISLQLLDTDKCCSCLPQCIQIMYKLTHHSQNVKFGFFGWQIFLISNMIQVNKIIPRYPFSKLFGDIGGYLGLSMGLSILTMVHYFNNIFIGIRNLWKKYFIISQYEQAR